MPESATAELFGVRIHSITFDETVDTIAGWVRAGNGDARYVLTPNVNHLVLYQRDAAFREAYEGAALVVPDGRYTTLLGRLLGQPLRETVNGSDLVPAILDAADSAEPLRVFLLGAMPGVAERAAARIERRWPAVRVVGTYSPPLGFEKDDLEAQRILNKVNEAEAGLLVVGLSPPKQEIWVAKHRGAINVSVAICAGATIDFLAGQKTRAPRWMQRSGLEWVHRILTEPKRLLPRYASDGCALIGLLCREMLRRVRSKLGLGSRT